MENKMKTLLFLFFVIAHEASGVCDNDNDIAWIKPMITNFTTVPSNIVLVDVDVIKEENAKVKVLDTILKLVYKEYKSKIIWLSDCEGYCKMSYYDENEKKVLSGQHWCE